MCKFFLNIPIPPNLILPNLNISNSFLCKMFSKQQSPADGFWRRHWKGWLVWAGLVQNPCDCLKTTISSKFAWNRTSSKVDFAIFHYGRKSSLELWNCISDGTVMVHSSWRHWTCMGNQWWLCILLWKFHDYQPLLVLGTILRTLMHWDQCHWKVHWLTCLDVFVWLDGLQVKVHFIPRYPTLCATLHQTWWGSSGRDGLMRKVCLGHFWKSSSVLLKSMICSCWTNELMGIGCPTKSVVFSGPGMS